MIRIRIEAVPAITPRLRSGTRVEIWAETETGATVRIQIEAGGRTPRMPSVAAHPVHLVREIANARRSPRLVVARQVHHRRLPQVLAQVRGPILLIVSGSLERARKSPRSRLTRPESAELNLLLQHFCTLLILIDYSWLSKRVLNVVLKFHFVAFLSSPAIAVHSNLWF